MEWLNQYDPNLIEAFAKIIATIFTVLAGLATAIWALIKFFDEKKKEREASADAEIRKIEQQQHVEEGRRAERVTALLTEFGKTNDPGVKRWITLALSVYPKETTKMLSLATSQFENEDDFNSLKLALISIGIPALREITKLNRIAQIINVYQPKDNNSQSIKKSELLRRTQLIIVQLLLYLENNSISIEDLNEIDLSNCNMNDFNLKGISFQKCKLNYTSFKRANLNGVKFRGAKFEKTNFLSAFLKKSDFTGSQGDLIAINANMDFSILNHSKLNNSNLDGAKLRGVKFSNTDLSGSLLRGALLNDSEIENSMFNKNIRAKKIKAKNIKCSRSKFISANLDDSDISQSNFEHCELMGMSAKFINAKNAKFYHCNLGGTDFSNARNLNDVVFENCQLSGAIFRGCDISKTKFNNSKIENAIFDN